MWGTSPNTIPVAPQAPDSNTWEIGGSRFGLYDANLMFGAYGTGGVSSPAAYATPSVPPIYGETTQSGTFSYGPPQGVTQPFNPKHSPLVLVVVLGIGAIAALHWLHWKEPKKEG